MDFGGEVLSRRLGDVASRKLLLVKVRYMAVSWCFARNTSRKF